MKNSSIIRIDRDPLIILRGSYLKICGGSKPAALLLSFFEYWHNIKLAEVSKNIVANDIAENHGDDRVYSESLLQFQTAQQLQEGLLGLVGRKAIEDGIKILVDLDFISIHKNPNPKYKFDSTRFFMLHTDTVNNDLLGVTKLVNRHYQKGKPGLPIWSDGTTNLVGTSTKTTSKITSKITTEKGTDESVPKIQPEKKKGFSEIEQSKEQGQEQKKESCAKERKEYKVKQGTKKIKERTKSVTEVEQQVNDNMLSETISDVVMEFRQHDKKTSMNIGKFWARCLIAQYPEDVLPTMVLSKVDCAKLNNATKAYEGDLYDTLGMVLENWLSFTEHAKSKVGAFGLPQIPTIDFILKWKDAIPSFKIVKSGAKIQTSTPEEKEKEKVMKMPKGIQLL